MDTADFQLIETNGIRLRTVVEGQGPLCILVHGWPESWYSWRHQIAPLAAAGYRVVVPDVRGYGGSDKPHEIEAYGLVELSDDVRGLIDAFDADQAVLIGHDWGAPIVWTTALRHPSRVRAVVGMSVPHLGRPERPLIDTLRFVFEGRFFYMLYFQESGVAERELEADPAATIRKVYYGASGDIPQELRQRVMDQKGPDSTMLEGMIDPDPLPAWLSEEDVAYYAGEFARSGFRGPLNRYRNMQRDFALIPEQANKISQPALFIAGSRDPAIHFGQSNLVDVTGPAYEDLRGKVVLEGAGHWVQQERPAEVNRALLDFLEGL